MRSSQIVARHPDLPDSLICAALLRDRERRHRAPSPPYRNPALIVRSGSPFNTRLLSVQESPLRQRRGRKSRLTSGGPTHLLRSQRQQASRVPRATMQIIWDARRTMGVSRIIVGACQLIVRQVRPNPSPWSKPPMVRQISPMIWATPCERGASRIIVPWRYALSAGEKRPTEFASTLRLQSCSSTNPANPDSDNICPKILDTPRTISLLTR